MHKKYMTIIRDMKMTTRAMFHILSRLNTGTSWHLSSTSGLQYLIDQLVVEVRHLQVSQTVLGLWHVSWYQILFEEEVHLERWQHMETLCYEGAAQLKQRMFANKECTIWRHLVVRLHVENNKCNTLISHQNLLLYAAYTQNYCNTMKSIPLSVTSTWFVVVKVFKMLTKSKFLELLGLGFWTVRLQRVVLTVLNCM